MANPQKENGFIPIANEIAEALAQTHLTPAEWQIIWVVLRKTYGWGKKADWISLSQLSNLTGISHRAICKAKQGLVSKKALLIIKNKLMLNKNYEEWVVSKKALVLKKVSGSANLVSVASANFGTHNRQLTKDTNTKGLQLLKEKMQLINKLKK